jgi:hypothetical protein
LALEKRNMSRTAEQFVQSLIKKFGKHFNVLIYAEAISIGVLMALLMRVYDKIDTGSRDRFIDFNSLGLG